MPVNDSISVNDDKTKDYSINAEKELERGQLYGSLQVQGIDTVDLTRVNALPYNFAGATLGFEINTGHSVTISAQHIPNFGNQVKASTNINMKHTDNHKLDVNAFTTSTMAKAIPNYHTYGGCVDYTFKLPVRDHDK